MRIKEIPLEEYKAMWDEYSQRMRFVSPQLDPILMYMTVIGQSGPGTPFDNEYERMMHEHLNPPMPPFIDLINLDEVIRIKPKRA